ncbi:MAG TPA: serpin family protein, partial [Prolixibacteraceae bacterium]|nr:serpin family protein [Prolixibacteraceae bacterium]
MKTKLFTAVIALFILFACEKADDKPGNTDLSEKSEQLIKADNEFGLEMFSRIYNSPECPENYMISPLSISLALSMAYNGANTQTK